MKLIIFKTLNKKPFTKYQVTSFEGEINGVKYTKEYKSQIPESTRIEYETIYLPIDKLEKLVKFGDVYKINNIQVSEDEFNNILKQIKE